MLGKTKQHSQEGHWLATGGKLCDIFLHFGGNINICRLNIIGPDKDFLGRKTLIIFLPVNLNMCFGCSKNRLNETVLLSTHNICFG